MKEKLEGLCGQVDGLLSAQVTTNITPGGIDVCLVSMHTDRAALDLYQSQYMWAADGDLQIGWNLKTAIIPYTSITSIKIEITAPEAQAPCITAVSTGDQLKSYIAECEPYWVTDTDGTLAFSIDGLCRLEGAQNSWTYTYTDAKPAANSSVAGYELVITIECGEDVSFIGTGTLN